MYYFEGLPGWEAPLTTPFWRPEVVEIMGGDDCAVLVFAI